jgi:DNA replication protein DnaC
MTQPERLTERLEQIRQEWGSVAQARLDAMPDRAEFEDRPYADPEARMADRWNQAIPNRFRWAQIDDLAASTAETIRLWSDAGAGGNLVLVGPVGAGKTHAAVAAARLRHERGEEVEFWSVVNLLDGLRDEVADSSLVRRLFDRLTRDADLLVLDDLGRHKSTEWANERLYMIVNQRWLDEKPTVVTTTASARQMVDQVGEHVVSRILDGATVITVSGADRRRSTL